MKGLSTNIFFIILSSFMVVVHTLRILKNHEVFCLDSFFALFFALQFIANVIELVSKIRHNQKL